MPKRKKKANNTAKQMNISIPKSKSNDDIKTVIVDALFEVEKRKAESKQKKLDEENEEWQKALGFKDYPKNVRFRKLKVFWNEVSVFFRFSFLPRDKISGNRATFGILKLILSSIFSLAKLVLSLASLFLIGIFVLQFVTDKVTPLGIQGSIIVIIFSLILFLLSRFFRIASYEIEKLDNKEYIFGIFAAITSIVSIVIAVISILYKGG